MLFTPYIAVSRSVIINSQHIALRIADIEGGYHRAILVHGFCNAVAAGIVTVFNRGGSFRDLADLAIDCPFDAVDAFCCIADQVAGFIVLVIIQ